MGKGTWRRGRRGNCSLDVKGRKEGDGEREGGREERNVADGLERWLSGTSCSGRRFMATQDRLQFQFQELTHALLPSTGTRQTHTYVEAKHAYT